MLCNLYKKEQIFWSLPSRERGLKFEEHGKKGGRIAVAPLAGAWIEMFSARVIALYISVAPLAGAWIEMKLDALICSLENRSLPSRERGLKS